MIVFSGNHSCYALAACSVRAAVQGLKIRIARMCPQNLLESLFIGNNESVVQDGLDTLLREIKTGTLDSESIEDNVLSFLGGELELLPGTKKAVERYVESIPEIKEVTKKLEENCDLLCYGVDNCKSQLAMELMQDADLHIVCMEQCKWEILETLEQYRSRKNVVYTIFNYDEQSAYNMRNLRRWREFTNDNLTAIPYHIEFLDAASNAKVIDYFLKNAESKSLFFKGIDDLNKKLLKQRKGDTDGIHT